MLELEARAEPSRLMSWASPLLAVVLMLAGGMLVFSFAVLLTLYSRGWNR